MTEEDPQSVEHEGPDGDGPGRPPMRAVDHEGPDGTDLGDVWTRGTAPARAATDGGDGDEHGDGDVDR
jgi:hypothetical protein